MRHALISIIVLLLGFFLPAQADNPIKVPILTYHDFHASKPGSMTVKTQTFENHLKWLKTHGFTVIPLNDLVAYLLGEKDSLPPKSVVITVDDGKASVYDLMRPIVESYQIPVTLFIYPSAISNAKYAMTWDQLKNLQNSGYFDIQSHTIWHPNFKQEKKKLSAEDYQKFVQKQLMGSKKTIESHLGHSVTSLAWPFGIYDDFLEKQAMEAGYTTAFSIDGRPASRLENNLAQPRYLIVENHDLSFLLRNQS